MYWYEYDFTLFLNLITSLQQADAPTSELSLYPPSGSPNQKPQNCFPTETTLQRVSSLQQADYPHRFPTETTLKQVSSLQQAGAPTSELLALFPNGNHTPTSVCHDLVYCSNKQIIHIPQVYSDFGGKKLPTGPSNGLIFLEMVELTIFAVCC